MDLVSVADACAKWVMKVIFVKICAALVSTNHARVMAFAMAKLATVHVVWGMLARVAILQGAHQCARTGVRAMISRRSVFVLLGSQVQIAVTAHARTIQVTSLATVPMEASASPTSSATVHRLSLVATTANTTFALNDAMAMGCAILAMAIAHANQDGLVNHAPPSCALKDR